MARPCERGIAAGLKRLRYLSTASTTTTCVPRLEANSSRNLAWFHQHQEPVVLTHNSPAMQKWHDWDYVVQTAGEDYDCDVEMGKSYNQGERITIPLVEYLHYLQLWQAQYDTDKDAPDDHMLYLAQNDLPLTLHDDITLPRIEDFATQKDWYNVHWWVGPAGTHSPLHYDPLDNFLLQIKGRKEVRLLSPLPDEDDATAFYSGPKWGQQSNTSAVNVFQLDMQRFPAMADHTFRDVLLEPGDVLYIPSKWWHAVRSLDVSISVNAWWR